MANMRIYSIDNNGGPVFEKPNITKRKPYAKDTNHRAASIDDAANEVSSIFSKVEKLIESIDVIKEEINELSEYWNNCIGFDGKNKEYVPIEDLNKSIDGLTDTCITGKETCESIMDNYKETINEINTYLSLLETNYKEYLELEKQKQQITLKYAAKLNKTGYDEEANNITMQMREYSEIPDITAHGRWVE